MRLIGGVQAGGKVEGDVAERGACAAPSCPSHLIRRCWMLTTPSPSLPSFPLAAPSQLPRFKGHPPPAALPNPTLSAFGQPTSSPSSPSSRQPFASPTPPQQSASVFAPQQQQPQLQQQVAWDVTPAEKQASDRFFANLDKFGRGVIDGDVAVPFMLESKLPESVLAAVWCVPPLLLSHLPILLLPFSRALKRLSSEAAKPKS